MEWAPVNAAGISKSTLEWRRETVAKANQSSEERQEACVRARVKTKWQLPSVVLCWENSEQNFISKSLGVGPWHQYFLKFPGWFQYTATCESQRWSRARLGKLSCAHKSPESHKNLQLCVQPSPGKLTLVIHATLEQQGYKLPFQGSLAAHGWQISYQHVLEEVTSPMSLSFLTCQMAGRGVDML
jgi:hypothetical protein